MGSKYQIFSLVKPYGSIEVIRNSKDCIKHINKLKNRFVEGVTYLSDDQMPLFRFFVAREIFKIGYSFEYSMSKQFCSIDQYHEFSNAFLPRFNDLVFTAIPQEAYGELNGTYPRRAL